MRPWMQNLENSLVFIRRGKQHRGKELHNSKNNQRLQAKTEIINFKKRLSMVVMCVRSMCVRVCLCFKMIEGKLFTRISNRTGWDWQSEDENIHKDPIE